MERFDHAYDSALAGDFGPSHALLRSTPYDGSIARAVRHAVLSLWWHADPARGRLPGPDEVRGLLALRPSHPITTAALARTCMHGERAAYLALDLERHAEWLELHRQVLATRPDARSALWLTASECFQRVLEGRGATILAQATALERDAAHAGIAALVVDAASLRARAAAECGDLAEATAIGRRAARMGRTEGLPLPQYLANLTLARLRRLNDVPHLTLRIATALAGVTPPQWYGHLAWELLLAGGHVEAARLVADTPETLACAAVRECSKMVQAARDGDRGRFDAARDGLRAEAARCPILRADIDALCDGLDGAASPADEGMRRWCFGAGSVPPDGLLGVALRAHGGTEGIVAYAMLHPERSPRRVLGIGATLSGPIVSNTRPGRIESAVCMLALAGDHGMDKASFFRGVYGFDYESSLHKGPLEVLVHRMRALLEAHASVERDERMRIVVHRACVVPDPRCAKSLDERLLRVLARHGAGTAKTAAAALGVPLRTAQLALKQLADDGACIVERVGRQVQYRVEDSTFHEPTAKSLKT